MSPPPRKIAKVTVTYRIAGVASDRDLQRLVAAAKACPVRLTPGGNVDVAEMFERA
jgi:uncharacterized OsmC-like protein